jgi:biopolymer transport protein ExbB
MDFFYTAFVSIRDFFEAGGDVLWGILFVTIVMWMFIIERFWYFRIVFPKQVDDVREQWQAREDQHSWYARRIRRQLVSEIALEANEWVPTIKTLIAVLPLFGLLGTVTGMVQVFDVMANTGTGNARLMAGGVSAATIPTMSGMVAALSGIYFGAFFEKKARTEVEKVEDVLRHF